MRPHNIHPSYRYFAYSTSFHALTYTYSAQYQFVVCHFPCDYAVIVCNIRVLGTSVSHAHGEATCVKKEFCIGIPGCTENQKFWSTLKNAKSVCECLDGPGEHLWFSWPSLDSPGSPVVPCPEQFKHLVTNPYSNTSVEVFTKNPSN